MYVVTMAPEWRSAYDAFLKTCRYALLYHSTRYMGFLVELLSCEQRTLLAVQDGVVVGALPLLSKDGPLGNVLNSLPYYGSNGGVLGTSPEAAAQLLAHYNQLLDSGSVAAATLVENPLCRMSPDSVTHELVDERIGQFTSLDFSEDWASCLMGSFHQKTRNMIRKAEKLGVVVDIENDKLNFVRDIHVQNMTEIGGLPKSDDFFRLIPRYFEAGKDYNIYVARLEGEPVAAVLNFYFNNTVEYYTPVVCKAYRDTQALSLAIFSAMVDASRIGFLRWNWGGTWLTQEGVYRFKKRWGTQDLPYTYFVQLNNRKFLEMTRAEVLAGYPSFYTLPFSMLKG